MDYNQLAIQRSSIREFLLHSILRRQATEWVHQALMHPDNARVREAASDAVSRWVDSWKWLSESDRQREQAIYGQVIEACPWIASDIPTLL